MRFRMPLFLAFFLVANCFCAKDKAPTGPSVIYSLSDLAGTWAGTVKNSYNTIHFTIGVDAAGNIDGSCPDHNERVISTWNIDSSGKVTGQGTFSAAPGGDYFSAPCSWSLQLSSDKNKLTGQFDVSAQFLNQMNVSLTKQ